MTLPSSTKGSIAKKSVAELLRGWEYQVKPSENSNDYDIKVEGRKIQIEFSSRWKSGIYKFQQIRDDDYEFLFCLGIFPSDAHAWVIRKEELNFHKKTEKGDGWEFGHQHGGDKASGDTWWLTLKKTARESAMDAATKW